MAEYPNCRSCNALCHAETMVAGECTPCTRTKIRNWVPLVQALLSAEAHVFRQVAAGKHEQDREDAAKWLVKYNMMMKQLRYGKRKKGWKR